MKNYFLLSLLFLLFSCSNSDYIIDNISKSYSGIWRASYHEYRGKTYPVSSCQIQTNIKMNIDKSGAFDIFGNSMSGQCIVLESGSGIWDVSNGSLNLKNSSGKLIKSFDLVSISNNEISVYDYSQNIDGIGGNDDAILHLTKN